MKQGIAIEKIIEQLQNMAKTNPGIHCFIQDNEWGVGDPSIELTEIMNGDEYLQVVDKEQYEMILKTIQYHKENADIALWSEMDEDERIESYDNDYNNFVNMIKEILVDYNQKKKKYENAFKSVVFKLK